MAEVYALPWFLKLPETTQRLHAQFRTKGQINTLIGSGSNVGGPQTKGEDFHLN
jgi:hypothetical protein